MLKRSIATLALVVIIAFAAYLILHRGTMRANGPAPAPAAPTQANPQNPAPPPNQPPQNSAHYTDISLQDLKAAIQSNSVTMIDCNQADLYNRTHIKGAIFFDANRDKLATLLPTNKSALIVSYCGGPACVRFQE